MTKKELKEIKQKRLGEERLNNQGCLMKIIEYEGVRNIKVKFFDDYGAVVDARYDHFKEGSVNNPYFPTLCGKGMIGIKYPVWENGKHTPQYKIWHNMIVRCFYESYKKQEPTYADVTCCDEWLIFENFVDWLKCQDNYDKWLNGYRFALDKDIIIKGNKIYDPKYCCIVPQRVNSLFTSKPNKDINHLPKGVHKHKNGKFMATCNDIDSAVNGRIVYLGLYETPEDAFYKAYKPYKEELIKRVAQEEYDKGNIIKRCYEAMINYEVEITD